MSRSKIKIRFLISFFFLIQLSLSLKHHDKGGMRAFHAALQGIFKLVIKKENNVFVSGVPKMNDVYIKNEESMAVFWPADKAFYEWCPTFPYKSLHQRTLIIQEHFYIGEKCNDQPFCTPKEPKIVNTSQVSLQYFDLFIHAVAKQIRASTRYFRHFDCNKEK